MMRGFVNPMQYAQVHPKRKLSSIKEMSPHLYKSLRLVLYTIIIWVCFMSAAVLTQKMYKTPYAQNNNPSTKDYFTNPFGIPIFISFFGMFYGFLKYKVAHQDSTSNQQEDIPVKYFLRISTIDTIIHILGNLAIILTSFTTYNLIHCCSLLSVVIVAVFFSKYRHLLLEQDGIDRSRTEVKSKQIAIAGIVVIGIVVFNYFSSNSENSVDKPLNMWTTLLIIGILIMEGFRPELVMQLRQKYHPRPSLLLYQIFRYNFFLMVGVSIISTQFFSLVTFLWNHDDLAFDLTLVTIFNLFGQIFIYRVLVLHKQHVIPFITTIRKVLTSILNIFYFHHQISVAQFMGIGIVAFGVIIQLVDAYLQIKDKNKDGEAISAKFQQVQQEFEEDAI